MNTHGSFSIRQVAAVVRNLRAHGDIRIVVTPGQRPMRGHAAQKPTVDEIFDSRERINRASTDFLKIDVDTALTFLHVARNASDNFRRVRNLRAARKAYDTVLRLIGKVKLNSEDSEILRRGLERLKSELEDMGESF